MKGGLKAAFDNKFLFSFFITHFLFSAFRQGQDGISRNIKNENFVAVEYLCDNRLICGLLINLIDCCGRFLGSVRYFLCCFFVVNIRFAFFRQVYGDSISDLIFLLDKSVLILKTTKMREISGKNSILKGKKECESANNSNSFNQQIELFRE